MLRKISQRSVGQTDLKYAEWREVIGVLAQDRALASSKLSWLRLP
ncbi:hypothetical protein ACYZT7_13090 [Pseudomonas sp. RT4P38]